MGRPRFKIGKCIPTTEDDSVSKESPSQAYILFKNFALTFANCLEIKTEQAVYL